VKASVWAGGLAVPLGGAAATVVVVVVVVGVQLPVAPL
jgi:hypothetical protein